ncbi:MAG: hypothetical protein KIT58_04355, partial [Planctomycetota bacterium]|nr:hypothetical protein [Planctomycetota bacterium]
MDASNLGIERIIRFGSGSRPDWSPRPPTEAARKAGRPVARIIDAWASPRARGFGTGFLITPRLLITNHHVFATASEAAGGAANFLHEEEGP